MLAFRVVIALPALLSDQLLKKAELGLFTACLAALRLRYANVYAAFT